MTSLRFVVAFVFLLFLNIFQNTIPRLSDVTVKDWFFLLIIAITSGVVSLFVYYKGLQHTKASIATLAELGFPLAAVVVNFFFLKETLVPMQFLGMAILLYGLWHLGRQNVELEQQV
jgi:drug/metabolite transporter (DMT)-like permease